MSTRSMVRPPTVALVLGAVLVAVALLADVLQGRSFRSFGTGQAAVAILGALIAAAGLALRRRPGLEERLRPAARSLAAGFRGASYLVTGALVFFVAVETATTLVAGRSERQDRLWRQVPEYVSQEWAERHAEEFSEIEERYRRYLVWRSSPFEGETLRVDEDGIRRTPGASQKPAALRVAAFGGSAMWGIGVPDELTLPAHLQRGLTGALEGPVRVVNLAERGYVSTQNLLLLNLELQAGRVPDLAVFYDGFNDVGVTIAGNVGGHYSEARVAGRLNRPLGTFFLTSRTVALLHHLLGIRPTFDRASDPARRERLAEEILAVYLGNYRLVDTLSRAYGFSFVFFWQPALVTSGKSRTPAEELFYRKITPDWVELWRRVYERIAEEAAARDHLVTLADAFDRETSSAFIDEVHVTPRGNELVAARMLEFLIPRLEARRASAAP